MTKDEIAALRALEAAATKGPVYGNFREIRTKEPDRVLALIEDQYGCGTKNDRDLFVAMRNALPALLDLAERAVWQHIETAPKDGTPILAYSHNGDQMVVSYGNDYCWFTLDGNYHASAFTHWLPLPLPPGDA